MKRDVIHLGWLCGWLIAAIGVLWIGVATNAVAEGASFGEVSRGPANYAPDRRVEPLMLLPVNVNGRWGYCDRAGVLVIGPAYDWTDYFYMVRDGTASASRETLWVARAMRGGRMGWLQYQTERRDRGDSIEASHVRWVSHKDQPADRVSEGYVVVRKGAGDAARFHLYWPNEETVTADNAFDGMLRVSDRLAAVEREGVCGYLNKAGEVVIPLRFSTAGSFVGGVAAVSETQADQTRWGLIDRRGRYRFQDTAGEIEELRGPSLGGDGLVAVKVGGRWGFLDRALRPAVTPAYDEVRGFANGRAAVREGDEWGYIDRRGRRQAWGFEAAFDYQAFERLGMPGRYEDEVGSSVALVKQGGKFGFIDSTGRTAIEPQFESAFPLFRGAARVSTEGGFGYVDRNGWVLWDARQAERNGIVGYALPDAGGGEAWPGLPGPDGASGEPVVFEYDAAQRLPE